MFHNALALYMVLFSFKINTEAWLVYVRTEITSDSFGRITSTVKAK